MWYALALDDAARRRQPELDGTFTLRAGSLADMPLLAQLPADPLVASLDEALVADRLSAGASLWLVTEGERLAFACWNFYGEAPLRGAAGGVVRLPSDVVVLEDSISSPDFRGRGVAPRTWDAIAEANRAGGMRFMVTKVTVANEASRRAVEKAGFREVARLRLSGPVWRTRIRVDPLAGDAESFAWMRAVERGG